MIEQKPWENEPDYEEFSYKGIDCNILRVEPFKHLCGYCKIPVGHKYYGVTDEDIPYKCHGGITFSEFVDDENTGYWIGFDCAHRYDVSPYMKDDALAHALNTLVCNVLEDDEEEKPTYKTFEFVRRECIELAEQILKDMQ